MTEYRGAAHGWDGVSTKHLPDLQVVIPRRGQISVLISLGTYRDWDGGFGNLHLEAASALHVHEE